MLTSLQQVLFTCIFSFQLISEEIADLRHNHATTMAKLAQFKRKHLELSHRILEVKCYTDIQMKKCAKIKMVFFHSISSGRAYYHPKEKIRNPILRVTSLTRPLCLSRRNARTFSFLETPLMPPMATFGNPNQYNP